MNTLLHLQTRQEAADNSQQSVGSLVSRGEMVSLTLETVIVMGTGEGAVGNKGED